MRNGSLLFRMMRPLTILAISFIAGSALHADLTLEQKIEGASQKGNIVTRVKGDKFRLDMPGGPAGPLSTIVDIKSGDVITLVHDKKIAINRTGAQIRQAQEARDRQAGGVPAKKSEPPKPRATGLTEHVGDYEAEIYTLSVDDSTETLWLVKDYPNFESIREHLQRVGKASPTGANRSATVDAASLPGLLVKRQKERGGQKMTNTLTTAKQDAIEDSVFETPADYRETTQPNPPALPPATPAK